MNFGVDPRARINNPDRHLKSTFGSLLKFLDARTLTKAGLRD